TMEMNPYELEIPDEDFPPQPPADKNENSANSAAANKTESDNRCPQCHQSIAPQAAICIHCGYDLKQGKKLKTKQSQSKNSATNNPSNTDKKTLPEEPAYVSSAVAAARRDEDRKKWVEQEA